MKNKYLIRLDDACPAMNASKWLRMEAILGKYAVKPLVGIIPHNKDKETIIDNPDLAFFEKVHKWENKGWNMALHGYDHVCITSEGMKGLNPMWCRSEFVGLSLEQQRDKIKKGYCLLKENGIEPKIFFAPSHTFDENTLEALRLETPIRIISDTIALKPFRYKDFVFIPQISGHCSVMPLSGIYTFCFHPNTMTDAAFQALESFLMKHKEEFISFDEIKDVNNNKSIIDKLISFAFFSLRKIRGLK